MDSITAVKLYEYSLRRNAELNVTQTCVACLASDDSICSIFSMDTKLVGMLWECAKVCVRTDPGLPVGLCSGCCHQLLLADDFRRCCKQTYDLIKTCPTKGIICISCKKFDSSVVAISRKNIRLSECTGIILQTNNNVLAGLCQGCSTTLTKVSLFRSQCKNTETLLRRFQPFVNVTKFITITPDNSNIFEKSNQSNFLESEFSETEDFFEEHKIKIENDQTIPKIHEKFQCDTCGYETDYRRNIINHMKSHLNDKQYRCVHCKKHFSTKGIMSQHQKYNCIKRLLWKCSVCSKSFKTRTLLKNHQAIANVHDKLECDICGFKTYYKKNVINHMKRHFKEHRHRCVHCQKHFTAKSILLIHQKYYCIKRLFWKCTVCKCSFESSALLKQHQAIPNVHEKFECDTCSFVTYYKKSIINHLKSHVKHHRCVQCQKHFSTKSILLIHQKYNCIKRLFWKCRICYKSFESRSLLKNHQGIPNVHEKFQCDSCAYVTYYKSYYKEHRKSHLKDTQPRCEHCKKKFSTKVTLLKHLKFDCINRLLWKCIICSKSFQSSTLLSNHQATPNVHVKFECDICGFMTYYKKYLTVHKKLHLKGDQHSCVHCQKQFNTKYYLLVHQKYSCIKRLFWKCSICSKSFESKISLKHHQAIPNVHEKFHCDVCGYVTYYKRNLINHMNTHFKNKQQRCEHCQKHFNTEVTLLKHQKFHCIKRVLWKCKMCNKSFKSSSLLSNHKAIPDVHEKFQCDTCSFVTYYKENLKKHIKLHVQGKQHQCVVCLKVFSTKSSLLYHQKYNCIKRLFWKCISCKKSFETSILLKNHLAIPNVHEQFQCDVCGYVTYYKKYLIKHMKTHFKDKQQRCEHCQKHFRSEVALLNHHKFHCIKRVLWKCSVCSKSFKTKALLKNHRAIANVHDKFECDTCGYMTYYKKTIIDHMNSHFKDTHPTCEHCKKQFSNKYNMLLHQKYHCIKRMYWKCSICDKSFESKNLLKKHRDAPNVHEKLQCDSCAYVTYTRRCLNRHYKRHVNKKQNIICAYCQKHFSTKAVMLKHQKYSCKKK